MRTPDDRRAGRIGARVLLALFASMVALLVVEGVASLAFDRSLRELSSGARPDWADPDRGASADERRGPYSFSSDPFVSFQLRADMDEVHWGARVRTDGMGLRVRSGPPAEEGATRIVVLGDSVAFGLGVLEEETIAYYLEGFLATAAQEGRPRPVVRTVASPSWNVDNSTRFLLDYLSELAPDIVLFVPVGNDLDTTSQVTQRGNLYADTPPRADGWVPPFVSFSNGFLLHQALAARLTPEELKASGAGLFNLQIHAGVTPESVRRYRHMASRLGDLGDRLRGLGARLALVPLEAMPFHRRLAGVMERMGTGVPILATFRQIPHDDRLADNAHTKPRFNREAALRIARYLLEEQWIEGSSAHLPPEDERYATNRHVYPTGEELELQRRAADRLSIEQFASEIDFASGRGCNQIYGGVRVDGVVGLSLFAVLKNTEAPAIVLSLKRLEGVRGLYPLDVHVEINGIHVGTRTVEAPEPGAPELDLRFEVPEDLRAAPFLDVFAASSNWALGPFRDHVLPRSYEFVALRFDG